MWTFDWNGGFSTPALWREGLPLIPRQLLQ